MEYGEDDAERCHEHLMKMMLRSMLMMAMPMLLLLMMIRMRMLLRIMMRLCKMLVGNRSHILGHWNRGATVLTMNHQL